MTIFYAYSIALILASAYAIQCGGFAGRWSVAGIWAGFVSAALAVLMFQTGKAALPVILSIEVASLLFKVVIAMLSQKRWPIILAAMHLNVVCSQFAALLAEGPVAKFLYGMSTVWAVPTLVVMTVGIALDRRHALTTP